MVLFAFFQGGGISVFAFHLHWNLEIVNYCCCMFLNLGLVRAVKNVWYKDYHL